MKPYEFTLIASGIDAHADDFEDRFFESGCGDATISLQKGAIIVEFTREAKNFVHAVVSAVHDVLTTGARVERIEPDHLVSLADIAQRTGLSRAACTLFAKGERGNDFPMPIVRVTTESPLWDWVEVSSWLHHRNAAVPLTTVVEARVVRAVNRCTFAETRPHGLLADIIASHSGLQSEGVASPVVPL